MADLNSNLPQLTQNQAQKEVLANALLDAASPAMLWGRHALTSMGLVWGYLGGRIYVGGAPLLLANGSLTLPPNQTVYIEVNTAGVVSQNSTGFTADKLPLYKVSTGAATVMNYEDHRNPMAMQKQFYGRISISLTAGNVTLTQAQSCCDSLELTGTLNAARMVLMPNLMRSYFMYCNTTGGQTITVKTANGTGVTFSDGQRRILECDGLNIVSFT